MMGEMQQQTGRQSASAQHQTMVAGVHALQQQQRPVHISSMANQQMKQEQQQQQMRWM
jgi:hypothetical protein